MIPTRRIPRGFTLLEMAVATAALGVALSAAMYIVVGVSSLAERVRRVGDTQDTARIALDALAGEIRMSGAGVSKDRKSTRLNSSHVSISYAVFCLKKKKPSRTRN